MTVDWFLNGTCAVRLRRTRGPIALGAVGTVDATGFAFTVNSRGASRVPGDYLR